MSNLKEEELKELYKAIIKIDNEEDCKNFLDDLLTIQEKEAFSQRVHAAQLLIDGETYQQVIDKTKISSATLARINKCVKNGKGYNKVLDNKKSN